MAAISLSSSQILARSMTSRGERKREIEREGGERGKEGERGRVGGRGEGVGERERGGREGGRETCNEQSQISSMNRFHS